MSTTIPSDIAYRLSYQDGMFLTAGLETLEQSYFVRTGALLNAMLYTPGVLSGLAVSQATANSVAIAPGGGIDPSGNFLVLPGSGAVPLSVPTTSANPSLVYLVFPSAAQQAAGMQANVVNLAGVPTLAAAGSAAPDNSIVLAQVSLNEQGQVTAVTDKRVQVTSRLTSPLTGLATAEAAVSPVPVGTTTSGVVTIPVTQLPTAGQPYVATISFHEQGTPAFPTAPQVVAQVSGAIPYPTAVGQITPTGFTLTVAAASVTPSQNTPPAPVAVNWWAFN